MIDSIVYNNCNENDLDQIIEIWNEEYGDNHFLKPFKKDDFYNKIIKNNNFKFINTIAARTENKLIGFLIFFDSTISIFIVRKEYRNNSIGREMFRLAEQKIAANGYNEVFIKYSLPICFRWYIPNTPMHDHPCAPGIRVNSNEYLFLSHLNYEPYLFQDAFHLNLKEYKYPLEIENILKRLNKDNLKIELYDSDKHYGLEEFYQKLNIVDFINVIKDNLNLPNPYPFLVVTNNDRIIGWTGAMWNEQSGRGHFDGIAILDEVRGNGLGKALFASLVNYNKNNGAEFMTFYTGLNNFARYIYKSAGFKIVQTFCYMKKPI